MSFISENLIRKETKSEELISLNNLTNLVNLSDEEKIKFFYSSSFSKTLAR